MLSFPQGGVAIKSWRAPDGFIPRYTAVSQEVLARAEAMGGSPEHVIMPMFQQAVFDCIPDLTLPEEDYVRWICHYVQNQVPGSQVFYADLHFLDQCIQQGRCPPAQLDPPREGMDMGSTVYSVQGTVYKTATKSLDLAKTTGVNWAIPKGFLNRYNAASPDIMRKAVSLGGGWKSVTVPQFVEACREVLGGLNDGEEEYLVSLAQEQRPVDQRGFIPDLMYLDKCLQQGRTLTSIKGPYLLPTIFLNDTTSDLFKTRGTIKALPNATVTARRT